MSSDEHEIKNVFVSHVHEDDDELPRLRNLLGKHGYSIRDSSIKSTNPNNANHEGYIKTGILAPCINWAGVMLVLISPQTHASDWVNWEVQYAAKQGKRIVGVYVHGGSQSDVPAEFQMWGQALVGWQGEQIIDAIEGRINNWKQPNGADIPSRDIPRYRCNT